MKTGVISYPPLINEQSLYSGGLRDVTNSYMNEMQPKFKRGHAQVNQLGCKCELIVQFHFWNKNISYISDQMLGGRPIANYDIKALNLQIDVKGIWSYQSELRVNYDAHNTQKDVTHYMFIQPLSETMINDKANYWLFAKEDISSWQIKEMAYSKAYVKQL